jgi:hypothetical protein
MAKICTLLSIGTASVLLAAGHAQAVSYSYDFTGNLSDQFTVLYSTSGFSSSSQTGGQLVYNTVGAGDFNDDNEIYSHTFAPTFDQSWRAEITATVPKSIEAGWAPNRPTSTQTYLEAEALLGVRFIAADGAAYSLSNSLGVWGQPTGRHYSAGYAITPVGGEWTDLRPGQGGNESTTDVTGMLGLSFDAQTKVLSAYNANQTLMRVVINQEADAQWGMRPGDHFQLITGFTSQGWIVPASTPLALDNFKAGTVSAPVPEPESYALFMAGIAVIGWGTRFRKRVR